MFIVVLTPVFDFHRVLFSDLSSADRWKATRPTARLLTRPTAGIRKKILKNNELGTIKDKKSHIRRKILQRKTENNIRKRALKTCTITKGKHIYITLKK